MSWTTSSEAAKKSKDWRPNELGGRFLEKGSATANEKTSTDELIA